MQKANIKLKNVFKDIMHSISALKCLKIKAVETFNCIRIVFKFGQKAFKQPYLT